MKNSKRTNKLIELQGHVLQQEHIMQLQLELFAAMVRHDPDKIHMAKQAVIDSVCRYLNAERKLQSAMAYGSSYLSFIKWPNLVG